MQKNILIHKLNQRDDKEYFYFLYLCLDKLWNDIYLIINNKLDITNMYIKGRSKSKVKQSTGFMKK